MLSAMSQKGSAKASWVIRNHAQIRGVMQGLDEEGLRAYSGHLQQEFLRPDTSSAKRPGTTGDAEDGDDSEGEEEDDPGPAPEDAARRYLQLMSTCL